MKLSAITLPAFAMICIVANGRDLGRQLQSEHVESTTAPVDGDDEEDILALFSTWNEALTKTPDDVVALYDDEAGVLLPTLSNSVRSDPASIRDYFVDFLSKGPQGEIIESHIQRSTDWAVNSGVYVFTFNDGSAVGARYSYTYRKKNDNWVILSHHSSAMPEVGFVIPVLAASDSD